MLTIRTQYFFGFAVMGSLLPFVPLYLADRGLTDPQIGVVMAAASFAIMLTPVLITLLADTRIAPRRLLSGVFFTTGIVLLLLVKMSSFWPLLICWAAANLVLTPVLPLQDSLNFGEMARRRRLGLPTVRFHLIRVWGTIGFMLPTGILLVIGWLRRDPPTAVALMLGVVMCLCGLINTFMLPGADRPREQDPVAGKTKLPTIAALKVMCEPHLLVFFAAMWLALASTRAYYNFYPKYVTTELGLADKWAGVFMNIGVAGEILFMLAFGKLSNRFGMRQVILAGMVAIAVRFAVLAALPTIAAAVAAQVCHGLMVIVVHVAPAIVINRYAKEEFRSSLNGLYVMLIVGTGQITGSFLSGYLAQWNVRGLFAIASVTALAASAVVIFAVKDLGHGEETTVAPATD